MVYQVRILKRALADLQAIASYLARESPGAAERVTDELLESAAGLTQLPRRGGRPRDPRLRAAGYRFLALGEYLIFYKVVGRVVRICRVLHGARAYRHLL